MSPAIPLGDRDEVMLRCCGPGVQATCIALPGLFKQHSSACSKRDALLLLLQEYTDLMGYLVRNRIIFVGSRIDDAVSLACTERTNDQLHERLCKGCERLPIIVSLPCMFAAILQVATQIVATMLALEAIDPTADIKLYINSAGTAWSRSLLGQI